MKVNHSYFFAEMNGNICDNSIILPIWILVQMENKITFYYSILCPTKGLFKLGVRGWYKATFCFCWKVPFILLVDSQNLIYSICSFMSDQHFYFLSKAPWQNDIMKIWEWQHLLPMRIQAFAPQKKKKKKSLPQFLF